MAGSQLPRPQWPEFPLRPQFNLTINPVPLTVTLHGEVSRVYGAANPNPVFISQGLVNGDTLGGTILVTAQTTATTASPVGVLPLHVARVERDVGRQLHS